MNRVEVLAASRLILSLLLGVWACQLTLAQQNYGEIDYRCTDTANKSCNSFVLFRTRDVYTTVPAVASLFRLNESEITRLNRLSSASENLWLGKPLVLEVPCRCVNASSMYLLKYVIKGGDYFWLLYNSTFESLASTQAILNANNDTDYTNLQIGQVVNVPIRCACPTVAQRRNGIMSLMTYTIQVGDTLSTIGASFNVDPEDIRVANNLLVVQEIFAQDTLIIPYKVSEPIVRINPPPPPAPGSDGGGPTPAEAPILPPPSKSSSGTSAGVYVGIGIGALAAVLLAAGLCVFLLLARKKRSSRASVPKDDLGVHQPLPVSSSSGQSPPYASGAGAGKMKPGDLLEGMSDVMDGDKPSLFSLEEIREAISNGHRIQGSVYRGNLRGRVVAIKQTTGNMSEEFKILCRVHHTNLIKLVGLCVTEAEDMYLVYEYAENGSLSDCLHTDFLSRSKETTKSSSSSFLSWPVRLQIALDVATGLEYIHDYTNPSYVHKDVKSSNILLDGAFRAKIANFAMAKSGGSNAVMTRHIAGTYGYMAPEYLAHGLVSPKADVFAFGVIVLELLSAQEAILVDENGQEKCLYTCIGPILEGDDQTVKGNLRKWIDPVLQNNYPLDIAQQLAHLARSCVENDPAHRPGMKDITYTLSNLLTASLEWESSAVFPHTNMDVPIEAR